MTHHHPFRQARTARVLGCLVALCLLLGGCRAPVPTPEPPPTPRILASAWLQGEPLGFDELGGQVVILDFWGSWYPSSREVIQVLKDLAARYRDRGLVILGCTQDESLVVEPLIRRLGIPYTVFVDLAGATAQAFAVRTVPTVLVFDRDGSEVYRGHPLRGAFTDIVRATVEARATR